MPGYGRVPNELFCKNTSQEIIIPVIHHPSHSCTNSLDSWTEIGAFFVPLRSHVFNFICIWLHVEILTLSLIFRILNSKVTFHLSFWFYVQIEVWFTRLTLISFLRLSFLVNWGFRNRGYFWIYGQLTFSCSKSTMLNQVEVQLLYK